MSRPRRKVDVLIIGSEGAGAYAAVKAHDRGADVLVLTKGRFGGSGSTLTGLADIDLDSRACREFGLAGNPEDSEETFFEDMLIEGKYINNQALVEVHIRDALARVREMVGWGMRVTDLLHTPGHRYPRGLVCSGVEVMRVLRKQVIRRKIPVAEHIMATELLTRDGRVVGAAGVDLVTGEFITLQAKTTLMATGGAMAIYPIYTAPEELTGDGHAMALRASAQFIDMEMTQFHPCNLLWPPMWRGIGFPFTIGVGGGMHVHLLNKWGERFMARWDPARMERNTRDILSIAIMTEVLEGRGSPSGGVYMSLNHLPKNLIDDFGEWFGGGYLLHKDWKYEGFDFKELVQKIKDGYAMEVGPASHFFMGGIRVNPDCETSLPGFYAIGEVAGGLHGANRLSGNALTQVFVQGAVGGEEAAARAAKTDWIAPDAKQVAAFREKAEAPLRRESGTGAWELKEHVRRLAWEKVGVVRTGEGLRQALDDLRRIREEELPRLHSSCKKREYNKEWIECLQIESMVDTAEAIAVSALHRTESRGAHYRKDFPRPDDAWLKNLSLTPARGGLEVNEHPLVVTRIQPPAERELSHA